MRMGSKNTLRVQSCVDNKTVKSEIIVTSLTWTPGTPKTQMPLLCKKGWEQACYHYSSAIRVNPDWASLTCPLAAATTASSRIGASAVEAWSAQHTGKGWTDGLAAAKCERDEFPPLYFLDLQDPIRLNSGMNSRGQLVRYIPRENNGVAGQLWRGSCFSPTVAQFSDGQLRAAVSAAAARRTVDGYKTLITLQVDRRGEMVMQFEHSPLSNDGLDINPCWPRPQANGDPGFALLTYDPYYAGRSPPYLYNKPYVPGINGGS